MKPRILIDMHYLELGGAESALLGLLSAFDYSKVDVDLFLHDHRGELMPYIASDVNVLQAIPQYTMLERPLVELVRNGFFALLAARLYAKIETRIDVLKNITHLDDATCFFNMAKNTIQFLPDINPNTEYDLAISFLTPHFIVRDKVQAKKKVAWIHTDYTHIYIRPEKEIDMWRCYDYIAAISAEAKNRFCEVFPELTDKVFVCENILSSSLIRQRAAEFFPEDMPICNGVLNLLSVGRYCNAKRFDEVPMICKKLLSLLPNLDVRWYIIGYGSDEELIRQRILEAKMEEHVILLGKRSNPYPYIKACDLYVQPSRYEGKSITVREAQILAKPVVITNYSTAASQVKDGIDGLIVPMPIDDCAQGIARAIEKPNLLSQITSYLCSHDYGNATEVNKIYRLI